MILLLMNNPREEDKKLFKYEVLRARLEIREFFLNTTVRDIYENTGQVLSLVRMQLASFIVQQKGYKTEHISKCGDLVAQSIRDLRSMCRSFYPDVDILKNGGFIEGLETTLNLLELSDGSLIKITGIRKDISDELKLFVFKIILDLLTLIKKTEGKYKSIIVSYTKNEILYALTYSGEEIDLNNSGVNEQDDNLTINDRAKLIEANICCRKNKTGLNRIILKVPLKISLYEY
jgi:hypothetical protein